MISHSATYPKLLLTYHLVQATDVSERGVTQDRHST
jgi:hypothetical protein